MREPLSSPIPVIIFLNVTVQTVTPQISVNCNSTPQTRWPANNRNVFLIVLKAWNSSIRVWVDSMSVEAPLLGLCLPFHCVLTWWRWIHGQALWGHFYKGLTPFLRAPPSGPNHLPKGSPPNAITLRLSFQQMNFREPQHFRLEQFPWFLRFM